MSTTTPTFVDLQGFIVNGKFTVKEVAILRSGTILSHYIFVEPTSWRSLTEREKRSVRWLTNNNNCLRWTDGFVPYAQAENLIRAALCYDPFEAGSGAGTTATIYVKGLEKSQWLRDILRERNDPVEAIELRYSDIARLSNISETRKLQCERRHSQCAMQNVFKLHEWWMSRNTE